ncbi:MAG: diguanylate cyclase [Armatimonadetes bacterium]|nr:diguanylate cyclase [Armatimonadota bacterium]MDW8029821.1 diguanylate cyclase [Armatimonadota bacterium]
MRVRTKVLIVAAFFWLSLSVLSTWLVFRNTQNLALTALSAGSLMALTLLAVTLMLLFQKVSVVDQQQKHIENLRTEWQATQESLKQLLSQRDQLGMLVQILHHFVLAATRQDIVLALLKELSHFLRLEEMEIVVFNTNPVFGLWRRDNDEVIVKELENQDEDSMPNWAKGQLTCEIMQIKDSLIVPIATDENAIALMKLTREPNKPFSPDEIRFMEAVANQTALALERVRLIAFLENLSLTDSLTGIANRRHLEWRLNEEVERAKRYHYQLSALMLDIDNFKQINDTYGHIIGDLVLQQIAQRLKGSLRRTDFLARYGGEEFVVLAPQTSSERAIILAERLRRVILESPMYVTDNLSLHITVSIGVAVFPEHAQNESDLIQAADLALYKAKQTGRNKVCLFEPELAKGGENNVRA